MLYDLIERRVNRKRNVGYVAPRYLQSPMSPAAVHGQLQAIVGERRERLEAKICAYEELSKKERRFKLPPSVDHLHLETFANGVYLSLTAPRGADGNTWVARLDLAEGPDVALPSARFRF